MTGELDGPYASIAMDSSGSLPGGHAERGVFAHGVRVGTWIRMTWDMGPPSYETQKYAHGAVVATRTLVNSGPGAKKCRTACAEDARSCEAEQRACPPGAPCMHRACAGDKESCELECDVVRVAPWLGTP